MRSKKPNKGGSIMGIAQARKKIKEISPPESSEIITFEQFQEQLAREPFKILRNECQLLYDMINSYMIPLEDEHYNDPENIGYIPYDTTKLFEQGVDAPFKPDMLFANKLIRETKNFKDSAQQNKIYVFYGPAGSGKSTFLNALIKKFEDYINSKEGSIPEVIWKLKPQRINSHSEEKEEAEVPCPSHCHPILLIPKEFRGDYLNELLDDEEVKERIFKNKEYDWLWKKEACPICSSLFDSLFEKLKDMEKVLEMVNVRPVRYNRRTGNGICVYGSGDQISKKHQTKTDPQIQKKLNRILDAQKVPYVFSTFAKTNTGTYVLMDVKENNVPRFRDLHNRVSEGVHKVDDDREETINSLFLAVMNPDDYENISDIHKSFNDRINYIKIHYILDFKTEVQTCRDVFGEDIDSLFLPGVLDNFARAIVATRIPDHSPALKEWIKNPRAYRDFCDEELRLLKMEFYTNNIPDWLQDEDKKGLTASIRKKLIEEADEDPPDDAISGRDSIKIFEAFLSKYASKEFITMDEVEEFFENLKENTSGKINGEFENAIPRGFIESLVDFYDYSILQQVKEALYEYNKEHIENLIKKYLTSINHEMGEVVKCYFTGEEIEITQQFLQEIEKYICPEEKHIGEFKKEQQKRYSSFTLTQEITAEGKRIEDTKQFQDLKQRYSDSLKENVLEPFIDNDTFRRAIKEYGTKEFESYDKQIQQKITLLLKNLTQQNYSEKGAQKICIRVLDKELAKKWRK